MYRVTRKQLIRQGGNFIEFEDRHLVRENLRDQLRLYRRNDQVYWGH